MQHQRCVPRAEHPVYNMVMCDVTVSCTSLEKDKRVGVEEYVCISILNFSLCRIYLKDFILGVYIFIYFHFYYYYFKRERETD